MNKIYALLALLMACFTTQANNEHNIWFFGYHAGIDFNSGSPVVVWGSTIDHNEGCSSICDTNGNLLFYTDGITIWNKNHAVMATGLTGNTTSTNSGIIVKQPGSNHLYYVFTTYTYTSFSYSIVDINLNGGLGGVTAKNVYINAGFEKVAITRHANGTDVWLVAHDNTNLFSAYLLTASGLNFTPVQSNAGVIDPEIIGIMKMSPKGDKLAFGFYKSGLPGDRVCVVDFDNATGIASGSLLLPCSTNQCYGVGFSPDGSKLYMGSAFLPADSANHIYQFDMNAGSSAAIIASRVLIGNTGGGTPGAIQIGPDLKIYIVVDGGFRLARINNPNAAGTACGFADSAVMMTPYVMGGHLGLPMYDEYDLAATVVPPVAAFSASDTVFCEGNCINYTDASTKATSWQWSFPGGTPATSTDRNPQCIYYTTSGSYDATLIVTNNAGTDTLTFSNYITVNEAPVVPLITQSQDTLYCSYDPDYTSYQWYADTALQQGATNSYFIFSHGGNYNVRVENSKGCSIAVGINILSVKQHTKLNALSLYPNPVTDRLIISGVSGDVRLSIVDLLGQTLLEENAAGRDDIYIYVHDLSAGIYFVRIGAGDNHPLVARFIKQ